MGTTNKRLPRSPGISQQLSLLQRTGRGKQIGNERLVIVAAQPGGRSSPRRIRDLAGVNWILNPEGCAARAALRRTLLRSNIDMIVAVETYNYELQLALVAQKRGLSLLPEGILMRSPLKSTLRTLEIPGLHFPLVIWMLQSRTCTGLDAVITELSQDLTTRLGKSPRACALSRH